MAYLAFAVLEWRVLGGPDTHELDLSLHRARKE